ncbi:MAG: MFS transporter, partial [Candidatus Thiodiazotropha sp.]
MPYWRLSSFYFFYFASLGALLPFWGLYLQAREFTPVEIGELMAVIMITKLIAPNIWGWIGDHTGHRMPIVRLASLLSICCFMGIFIADGFWSFALVMMLFSFFWNASLPQFEAVTMSYLREHIQRYSL